MQGDTAAQSGQPATFAPYGDALQRSPERISTQIHVSDDSIILIPVSAFLFGFVSGLVTSSRLSGRQFLAENAHRLPTTVQGWYFYQKSKNYRVMFGGVKGGLRTGAKLGSWTLAFVGMQEIVERGRKSLLSEQQRELPSRWASGALAGTTLAGAAALIYRLPRAGGGRRLLLGTSFGLVAGLCQDLRFWLRAYLPQPESTTATVNA